MKLTKNNPKMVKFRQFFVGNLQKYRNIRKFVQLGCPDPTPSAYVVKIDDLLYRPEHSLSFVRQEEPFEFEVFGKYFFHIPKSTDITKIVNTS